MEGNELKEVFFCRRLENYMVCITVTFDEEMRQTVEDFIASLDDGGENGGADQSSSQSIEGTVENGYYTNETFGIRFPITDNMRVMGEKEMDTVQGIGSEYMENEGIASEEQIEKASDGTLYDAAIYLEDGLSNISVCYENMDITYGGSIDVDEEMYGAALRLMMSRLEGFDYEFREDSTEVLGGKEYYRMDFDVSARGTDIYQIYIFRKEENYMISFIITYQDGMERLHIGPGHMYSYITPIIVCDTCDEDAVKALKKCHIYKSFRFSLHGWMDFHAAAVIGDSDRIESNRAGRTTAKILKKVLYSKK